MKMATLKVSIFEARDVPVMDRMTGLAAPYVVVKLGDMEDMTGICQKTRNAIWCKDFHDHGEFSWLDKGTSRQELIAFKWQAVQALPLEEECPCQRTQLHPQLLQQGRQQQLHHL